MVEPITKKISEIEKNVAKLLEVVPETRDSDKELVWAYYRKVSEDTFQGWFFDKGTNTETITRTKRMLQVQNPSLRGETWWKRHKLETKVRKRIVKVKVNHDQMGLGIRVSKT